MPRGLGYLNDFRIALNVIRKKLKYCANKNLCFSNDF